MSRFHSTAENKRFFFDFSANNPDISGWGQDRTALNVQAMKSRDFSRDILTHCYQRTADNGVLFYSYSDYLEYFTLYCVLARKHGIRVWEMCLMPDHVHDGVSARTRNQRKAFKWELNTRFSHQYNRRCGLNGPLLESPYGRAVKYGAKKARTNIIYIVNNPVERQLVAKAEEYRWNFLAYAKSDHPFSEKLVIRKARLSLQQAVKEVKLQHEKGNPLSYAMLQRMFSKLTWEECQQLTDFIISTYNVIDYSGTLELFDGSYEAFLSAAHANTGSEYDINEPFLGKTDKPFATMSRILLEEAHLDDIHDFLSWTPAQKYELFLLLRKHTDAMGEQIAKFLHLKLKKETDRTVPPFWPLNGNT